MHTELQEYLRALDRDDSYRVDEVLKSSPAETTERVFFMGANGSEKGPFVRKRCNLSSGLGSAYARIWAEQQAGKRFAHLPRLIECYATADEQVVVMEYVVGETLAEVVYRCDPSVELACDIFRRLCDAVCEMHMRFDPPLIHRDLKPSNIMVSADTLTIIDLGIARTFAVGAEQDTVSFGTRSYAPPEQFGYGQTDVRSDIYAMGMILYYCLTEKTPDSSVRAIGFEDERIPLELRSILVRATEFDPARRYEDVAQMRRDFEEAVTRMATRKGTSFPGSPQAFETEGITESSRKKDFLLGKPKLPLWTAIVRNGFLIGLWVLFVAATTQLINEPKGSFAQLSFAGRVCMGYGIFLVAFGALVYLLADKRALKKRIPRLARVSRIQEMVFCILFAVLITLISTIIAFALP